MGNGRRGGLIAKRNVIKNFNLHHVPLLSNNHSERSTTDHEKKRVGKTQAGGTEPQTA